MASSLSPINSISHVHHLSIWRFAPLRFCPLLPSPLSSRLLSATPKPFTATAAATKPTRKRRICPGKMTDSAGGLKVELGLTSLLLASMSFVVPAAASDSETLSCLSCISLSSSTVGLMLLDATNAAALATQILRPVLAALNVLFVVRIVLSWYPQLPLQKLPYVIAYAPTEPLLAPTRRLIPPVGGVDISPVIWVALVSFSNEILLGQQGLLLLLSQQQA